jgi:hypothetical protein
VLFVEKAATAAPFNFVMSEKPPYRVYLTEGVKRDIMTLLSIREATF